MCTVLLVAWLISVTSYVGFAYTSSIYGHKYLMYMIYMSKLVSIFVAAIYLAIQCEGDTADSCVLSTVYKNVGSICPFSIITVSLTFALW